MFDKIKTFIAGKKENPDGKSILIVSEKTRELDFITKVLEKKNYRLFNTENQDEGFQITQKDKPSLVILSQSQPVNKILDLCIKIKKSQEINRIPVLTIAGHEDTSNLIEYVHYADAYLIRPFNEKELIRHVETLILGNRNIE